MFWPPDGISLMLFHVVTRTMTMISAATIHVQIIELVIGNPRTLKISGAADGTFSSSTPAVSADAEAGATTALPADAEAGWAFRLTAKIAVKKVQANIILPNRFT